MPDMDGRALFREAAGALPAASLHLLVRTPELIGGLSGRIQRLCSEAL